MTDTQWGAPLTGAQMKLLMAAGLPDDCEAKLFGHRASEDLYSTVGRLAYYFDMGTEEFSVPANHPAYTLAKAGWLDGRNVRLWFGGDKAPDDWDGGRVLLGCGMDVPSPVDWRHGIPADDKIIAYIAKVDVTETPVDDHQETVTIAKMTEAEAAEWLRKHGLKTLGLIKPEPTREDRFWAAQPNGGAHVADNVKAWVREALNFDLGPKYP